MKNSLPTFTTKINFSPICTATPADITALHAIWRAAFGESSAYIRFVLSQALSLGRVLWIPEGCSCLTLFPLTLYVSLEKPTSYKGFYVYGVATHPDFQGQGFASALLRYAATLPADFLLLYPAQPDLVAYYAARGFTLGVAVPPSAHPGGGCSEGPEGSGRSEGPGHSEDPDGSGCPEGPERAGRLGLEALSGSYARYLREVPAAYPYAFLWPEPLFKFAWEECLERGGYTSDCALHFPDTNQVKPYLPTKAASEQPSEALLQWLAPHSPFSQKPISVENSFFGLPLD